MARIEFPSILIRTANPCQPGVSKFWDTGGVRICSFLVCIPISGLLLLLGFLLRPILQGKDPADDFAERLGLFYMASPDAHSGHEWIERVKSGGAVPLLEPDNCPNGWATPSGDVFMVRGPEYLSTKEKVPGGDYLLKPLGFDWIKGPAKICEVLKNPNGRVKKAVDKELAAGNKPFIWAFNLQLPNKDNYSAIAYFVILNPIPEGSLMEQFIKGDDSFRNSRFKLIANIVKGPWIVRKAVGEQAICILGRAVHCNYFIGENYMEVDVDIGSSMVANAIVHLAFGYITTLTVDLAFLIESQAEQELPERILGAVRFSELDPASAKMIEPPPNDEIAGNAQSFLPTRLWKSIGQGFSHFLHTGSQDGSQPATVHLNGGVHDGENNIGMEKWMASYVLTV
ncbi:hypothetical protein H6P81_015980 [Aristolochia fimbriata]|uniref:Protein ENHANCED DISEASE RESISTANCE 2 C-terminal domain-containing protein n=1 Tax=Aristolochia fimbriata TaxID=158543 RepID=A0AAV7E946_ARIFI|nr:hypothetical protein H6P81_015980 [Aristolochia fimbriata]